MAHNDKGQSLVSDPPLEPLFSTVKAAEAANLELTISAKPRPLDELRPLAERLAQQRKPSEAARLKTSIHQGLLRQPRSPSGACLESIVAVFRKPCSSPCSIGCRIARLPRKNCSSH